MTKGSESVPALVAVEIPTTRAFLKQYHDWVAWKVSIHFKRDKERIPDTAQRARLRLLQKEFVSRWFFKHLTEDLVDLSQATEILGGVPVTYVGKILPVHGRRSSPSSLWRVKDLLAFAKFDYYRFFYSAQGHTIASDKVLRLLGYGSPDPVTGKWVVSLSDYGALESLYRQGRLKPSELTEHDCSETVVVGSSGDGCSHPDCTKNHYSRGYCSTHYHLSKVGKCQECVRGRRILNASGVSLVHRWSDPSVAKAVSKLRWNDQQLIPFLREWRRSNMVKGPPKYIMRPSGDVGIDAGLKKYAYLIVYNDVINNFKSMSRTDDMSRSSEDGRLDPELSSDDAIGWESSGDSDDSFVMVVRDQTASESFRNSDRRIDIQRIMDAAALSEEELLFVEQIDLSEVPAQEVAAAAGVPVSKVHRVRTAALLKMKTAAEGLGIVATL